MTRIKVCGITRLEDASFCAARGIDYLGFIFVTTSPRYIDPREVAAIARRLRSGPRAPKLVGVFQDASAGDVHAAATVAGVDMVQLHGSETDEEVKQTGFPAIKALRVGETLPDTTSHPSADWLLFDTFDDRRSGGTGRRFDWSLLSVYARSKPFFLSGGLTPDSVAGAISLVRPDAVDLSSGVEAAPGVKDHHLIDQLLTRVRR